MLKPFVKSPHTLRNTISKGVDFLMLNNYADIYKVYFYLTSMLIHIF